MQVALSKTGLQKQLRRSDANIDHCEMDIARINNCLSVLRTIEEKYGSCHEIVNRYRKLIKRKIKIYEKNL